MLRIRSQASPTLLRGKACPASRRSATLLQFLMMVSAVVLSGVAPSYGQSGHGGELNRWVPSFGIELGIQGHTGKGNLNGTEITGPRVINPPFQRGDLGTATTETFASREEILSLLIGGNLEIMSPAVLNIPTHPRFFFDLNVSAVLTREVGLAVDADPGPLSLVEGRSAQFPAGEGSIIGRGSLISVQPQGPAVHIGFGVALTFDFGPNRIRVKPSVVYTRLRQDIVALTNRPIRLNEANGPSEPQMPGGPFLDLFDPANFRFILARERHDEIYHGAGFALELEYETGNRIGPLDLTLFIKGHASHLFGDLRTKFAVANPDFPDEIIFYKFSQDRWTYRGSLGVRFRFVPRSRSRR
jgi:hypothetical protein